MTTARERREYRDAQRALRQHFRDTRAAERLDSLTCTDCGLRRRTQETLRVHRALAHPEP